MGNAQVSANAPVRPENVEVESEDEEVENVNAAIEEVHDDEIEVALDEVAVQDLGLAFAHMAVDHDTNYYSLTNIYQRLFHNLLLAILAFLGIGVVNDDENQNQNPNNAAEEGVSIYHKIYNFFRAILAFIGYGVVDDDEANQNPNPNIEIPEANQNPNPNIEIAEANQNPNPNIEIAAGEQIPQWQAAVTNPRQRRVRGASFDINEAGPSNIENAPQGPQPSAYLSNWKIIVIGVYAFCGTSFTSAPFALRDGGWLSICLLLFVSLVAYISSILVVSCGNHEKYEDIGELAIPHGGRLSIMILSFFLSYATCIGCIILVKDNLEYFFPFVVSGMSLGLVITIALLFMLLCILCLYTVKDDNPYLPASGVVCMIIVLVCVILVSITHIGFSVENTDFVNIRSIHVTFGFYVYFFCGQGSIPFFFTSTRDKANFGRRILYMISLSTFLYAAIAIIGYGMFQDEVKSCLTLNLPRESKLSYIAFGFTVLDLILRFLLNMTTVIGYSDNTLFAVAQSDTWGRRMCMYIIKVVLVFLTIVPVILSHFIDDLYAQLVTFGGAIIGVGLAFVVPSICFVRLMEMNQKLLFLPRRSWASIILAVGILGGISTTIKSIEDMIN